MMIHALLLYVIHIILDANVQRYRRMDRNGWRYSVNGFKVCRLTAMYSIAMTRSWAGRQT